MSPTRLEEIIALHGGLGVGYSPAGLLPATFAQADRDNGY